MIITNITLYVCSIVVAVAAAAVVVTVAITTAFEGDNPCAMLVAIIRTVIGCVAVSSVLIPVPDVVLYI